MAGLASLLGYWLSSSRVFDEKGLLSFTVVFLICGFGNTINDYFDVELDKKLKPKRPLPSGRLSSSEALAYSIVLFVLGNYIAYRMSQTCLALALAASVLLFIYPWKLKGVKLAGNLLVSFLVSSAFIFGEISSGTTEVLVQLLAIAAFLANLSREIVKDIEDISAGGEKRSLPKMIGPAAASLVAAFLLLAAMLLAALFVPKELLANTGFSAPLSAGYLFLIAAVPKILKREAGEAKDFIRYGMLLILFAFILGKI